MYLVDIGNRYAHLFDGHSVIDLEYSELFAKYKNSKLYYINVNPDIKDRLEEQINWTNLEPFVNLSGIYSTMGIDRQVLLKSAGDGIYIDTGSAITIDLKYSNRFIGGTILPGIWRLKEAYRDISSVLVIDELDSIDIDTLPNSTTKSSVSYGIIAPIVALIEKINTKELPIYCCGGDGELLSTYLKNAKFDKFLIFKGMQKVIKESKC